MFSDLTQKRRILPQRQYQGILPGYYSPTRFNQQRVRDQFLRQNRPGVNSGEGWALSPAEQSDLSRGRYELNPNGQLQDNYAARGAYLKPVSSGGGVSVYPVTPSPKYDNMPGITPAPPTPVPTVPGGNVYPVAPSPKYDTLPPVQTTPTVPTAPVGTTPTVPVVSITPTSPK